MVVFKCYLGSCNTTCARIGCLKKHIWPSIAVCDDVCGNRKVTAAGIYVAIISINEMEFNSCVDMASFPRPSYMASHLIGGRTTWAGQNQGDLIFRVNQKLIPIETA